MPTDARRDNAVAKRILNTFDNGRALAIGGPMAPGEEATNDVDVENRFVGAENKSILFKYLVARISYCFIHRKETE